MKKLVVFTRAELTKLCLNQPVDSGDTRYVSEEYYNEITHPKPVEVDYDYTWYNWNVGDTVYYYYCDSDDLEWKIDCAKLIRIDQGGYWTDTSEKGQPGVRIVEMSPNIHSHTLEEAERKLPKWIEWANRKENKNV